MRKIFAAAMAAITFGATAFAQQPAGPAADPAVQLALNALPPITDERVRAAIAVYSRVAQGWWVQSRCKIDGAQAQQQFSEDLALVTQMMRVLMGNTFKVEPQKAGEYTETIQMYALNVMSANKFFDCGEQAQSLVQVGKSSAGQIASGIRRQLQQPPAR